MSYITYILYVIIKAIDIIGCLYDKNKNHINNNNIILEGKEFVKLLPKLKKISKKGIIIKTKNNNQ